MISHKIHPKKEPRGTVLILCVALLVILGLVASTFVILSHTQRASSRALSRADQLEQVRQMSLAYVRTLLLEDIVTADVSGNAQFLTGSAEPYDSPGIDPVVGIRLDPWLGSHWDSGIAGWRYLSNITGDSDPTRPYQNVTPAILVGIPDDSTDTDGDRVRDAWWIPANSSFPFTNITAPDGTQYRVAIRIVDTNALANINIGAASVDGSWPEQNTRLWDSQYPCYLDLRGMGAGSSLDSGGAVPGRISGRSSDPFTALTYELYPHLANNNYTDLGSLAPPQDYIRPFDAAEELALRMMAGPGTDLNGRLGSLLASFSTNSRLLTAYSWTMQIRPSSSQAIEDELTALGFPGPCKIPLEHLFDSDALVRKNARRAVYLGLVAALLDSGMNLVNAEDDATEFFVSLMDYIDYDDFSDDLPDISVIDSSANSLIDFGAWPTAPAKPFAAKIAYGTDSQPIISEVYSYRYYDWTEVPPGSGNYTFVINDNESRYAVELYNPTGVDINLSGWVLDLQTTSYDLSGTIAAGGFWTITSHDADHLPNSIPDPKLVLTPPSAPTPFAIGTGEQLIELARQGPGGAGNLVVVDRCEENFGQVPLYVGNLIETVLMDFQRPGNNYDGDLIPAIAVFQDGLPNITLGTFPTINNSGAGGQLVFPAISDGQLHSLGELFYVLRVAYNGANASLILAMEAQPDGDSTYRLDPSGAAGRKILQYFTLRTGLYDNADNDGDGYRDDVKIIDGTSATAKEIVPEARVPGLINVNTAPYGVLQALHYYYQSAQNDIAQFIWRKRPFTTLGSVANKIATETYTPVPPDLPIPITPADLSKDEDSTVGSPDGITVDNEEKLFHFRNVANLISVRSDVFVVYITIQASDRDGKFTNPTATLRTMAIVDRSFCLRPQGTTLAAIPLPRIVAQTTLP